MRTQGRRLFRRIASPLIGLLSALCLVPAALAQQRYLNLTWVDRSGEVIGTIGAPGEYRGVDVSSDGRVAAHAHSGNGGDVWLFAPNGKGTRLVAEATGVQDNAHPIFSPDGKRIVYSSLRDGVWGLYIKSVDGSGGEERVYGSGRTTVPMSWSPDGRFIVFWENTGFEWVLPLAGGRTPFRLMTDQSSHSQISPDGKWVAYLAGGNVWVRGFPAGTKAVPVSSEAGFFPRWRADGRELFYVGLDNLLHAVAVSGPLDFGEPKPLFRIAGAPQYGTTRDFQFDVSPDGQRFIMPTTGSVPPVPYTVIENWQDKFRR